MNIDYMRKYGWVVIMGLFMIGILLFFLGKDKALDISQLKFTENVHGIDINLFYDDIDDVYYLFLPSYVNINQVEITKPDYLDIDFATSERDYGGCFSDIPIDEPIYLTIITKNRHSNRYTFRILQSRNINTLFIETGGGGMENIRLNKDNKAQCSVVMVTSNGKVDFNGMASISGRGNSTFGAAKRPFNLKFSQPVNLMGGGKNSLQNWCLLANYADDSQIRNALCYYIADKIGIKYTSDIDFVSLFINGDYCGLYNLATKQNYLRDADDILAVFEMTLFDRIYDNKSDHDFYFRTRYGDTETIIKAINSFEKVLYNDTVTYNQLEKYADLHSIAQKYFVDAVCSNSDVRYSQFFMLDENSRISSICAWDYDLSFGVTFGTTSFSYNRIVITHPWYNALFKFIGVR